MGPNGKYFLDLAIFKSGQNSVYSDANFARNWAKFWQETPNDSRILLELLKNSLRVPLPSALTKSNKRNGQILKKVLSGPLHLIIASPWWAFQRLYFFKSQHRFFIQLSYNILATNLCEYIFLKYFHIQFKLQNKSSLY